MLEFKLKAFDTVNHDFRYRCKYVISQRRLSERKKEIGNLTK